MVIVLGIKSFIFCIVVKYRYVKVLVMEGDVRVFICGSFCGIGIIYFGFC